VENYRNGPHSRYDLKYHFVWVTEYREPVLVGEGGIVVGQGASGAVGVSFHRHDVFRVIVCRAFVIAR
jgi:hypothetical protein